MIKSIRIVNFQSHKDTYIDFNKGVNMIVGTSDSGKSAILRAIRWVIHNKPAGDDYISHWAKKKGKQIEDTYVTLTFDNGNEVTRYRGKNGNQYIVNGTILEAFGSTVPEPVIAACSFNETNIQEQHSGPFLLNNSGGEIARFFNKIVKLDSIDYYLSSIESMRTENNRESKLATLNAENTSKELSKYTWTDKAERLITRLEKLEERVNESVELSSNVKKALQEHNELTKQLGKLDFLDRAIELSNEFNECRQVMDYWLAMKTSLYERIEAYRQYKIALEKLSALNKAEELTQRFDKVYTKYTRAIETRDSIKKSIHLYRTNSELLLTIDSELSVAIKELPKVCPLCGGAIKEHKE